MRRFTHSLATALVVLALTTTTVTAQPLGGDDPRPVGPITKVVRIVKALFFGCLDDLGWPKP